MRYKGEELVIIPRKIYERLLFKVELDRDLKKALEDVKKGRLIGPFSTAKEAIAALKEARKK